MTARYPLVLNGTTIEELQSSDTLAGVDAFASGTTMLFLQAAAPTGWTQSTTHNDKALRIVSGSGGGSGGSNAFSSSLGASGTTGATTLSTSQIASHPHTVPYSNSNTYMTNPSASGWSSSAQIMGATAYAGELSGFPANGRSPVTAAGGGGSHTHSLGINVQYVDAIICVKD